VSSSIGPNNGTTLQLETFFQVPTVTVVIATLELFQRFARSKLRFEACSEQRISYPKSETNNLTFINSKHPGTDVKMDTNVMFQF